MPVQPGVLNYQQSPIFDTYQLAASTASPTKIVFFETPTGASKGRNLTNMTRGFQLTAPENFTVNALRFVPLGCDEADILSLMQNYSASLIVMSGQALHGIPDYRHLMAPDYEPGAHRVPDADNAAVIAQGKFETRVSVPVGTYVWGFAGYSSQADGYRVRLLDVGSGGAFWAGRVFHTNITGQGQTVAGSAFPLVPIDRPRRQKQLPPNSPSSSGPSSVSPPSEPIPSSRVSRE